MSLVPQVSRLARRGLDGLLREWRAVVAGPCRRLGERGPLGIALALFAAVAVIGLHEFQQTALGADVLRVLSEVRADQPLWLSLLRTPVSMFVPAVDLSAWGGLPRLILAFALAELAFGRVRTLVVAYAATLAGTLGARVLIALGPDRLGLPADAAHAVDTGASAAIVGLFAYAAVALRAPLLFLAAVVPTVAGSLAEPHLAGREHLIAVAVAMVLGVVLHRERGRRRGTVVGEVGGAGSGGPVGLCPTSRCQWPLTDSTAVDQEAGHGRSRRAGSAGRRGDRGDPRR